jgi:hypothetical protein
MPKRKAPQTFGNPQEAAFKEFPFTGGHSSNRG